MRPARAVASPRRARSARKAAAFLLAAAATLAAAFDLAPPETPVDAVVESFHGELVVDPYRWLEDTGSPATREWFEAQDAHARSVLGALPGRAALRGEIASLLSANASVHDVRRGGERVFALRREAGEQTFRLVVRDRLDGPERVAVDPARWRTPTEAAAIDYYAPSPNGRLVAVAISLAGSESSTLHVLDVDTGADVGAPIPRADFGFASWRFDSAMLWYLQARETGPDADPADRYRDSAAWMREFSAGRVAGPDVPVAGRTVGPGLPIGADDTPTIVVSPVSSWALAVVRHGVAREVSVFAAPLSSVRGPQTPWRRIVDRSQGVEDVDLRGEWLYLRTNEDAPRYRLVRWSLRSSGAYRLADAQTVMPEGGAILAGFGVAKDALYVHERDVGVARISRLEFNVKVAKRSAPARRTRGKSAPAALPKPAGVARATAIRLPFAGAVSDLVADPLHAGALVRLAGWTEPPGYFAIAPATGAVTRTAILARSPVSMGDLAVTQVRVASHDGTPVPLTVVAPRKAARDGKAPAIVEAYGAYGIALEPAFQPSLKAWFDRGGVYAVAHVRGGGELGPDWHLAGRQGAKPNTWLDLVACAEHLAKAGYASRDRIAIRGASAGGLAVVNAMIARPALFRAVVSEVGFHDAVRGEVAATGPANVEEFGSVATPEGFRALAAMSPYVNAADGVAYPAVLFTAGYNDPRVLPWDPGKMAARLQAIAAAPGGSGAPVLLRTDFAGGHGLDATLDQIVDETADVLAFLLWQTDAAGFALPTAPVGPKD
jgi:prolyl oligopeptidase